MKICCQNCRFLKIGLSFDDCVVNCSSVIDYPEVGCSYFKPSVSKYVLLHRYEETGFISVVAFSDSYSQLIYLSKSQPHFGSRRHSYFVIENIPCPDSLSLTFVKDSSLLNICKNVADYLSVAEFAMLHNSYFKASSWFDKAKNSASFASVILENY